MRFPHISTAMMILILWATIYGKVHAAPSSITYTFDHHLFTVSVAQHPEWRTQTERWFFRGSPAMPPARFLSCGKDTVIDPGWTKENTFEWNAEAIMATIGNVVASKLDRPAGNVTIRRSASGTILFTGRGLSGREVDQKLAAKLTRTALEHGVSLVVLPIRTIDAVVNVEDPELRAAGIREVVAIGESVFAASPVNRRHNIAVGMKRFNGHLIPQGTVFSFNETLGKVHERAGYRKELVIQGETTLPDFGGGLCQVSTTAFRGPWEYGLPIVRRKNHSYAVSYYSPQGTDATVYPPNVDMKFFNDTPGALLIQTFTDDRDRAFFLYYGTRDARQTEVFGPYITDRTEASHEEKIVYTTEIPPEEKRKAGERHDGMKALWYRRIVPVSTGSTLERVSSTYEARPLTWQIGVAADDTRLPTSRAKSDAPNWLPSKQ